MVKLTFDFPSVAEAEVFLNRLSGMAVQQEVAAKMAVQPAIECPVPAAATKRGRPKAPETGEARPVAAKKMPNQPVTIQAEPPGVIGAFREVFNQKGGTVATGILKAFDATCMGEVPEDRYPEFFAACEAALA